MKKRMLTIGAAAVVLVSTATEIRAHGARSSRPATTTGQTEWAVAGAGRVEPESEGIQLGAEMSGKFKAVYVEECDLFRYWQLLAELENADYRAQVASSQASVRESEAQLRK